MSIADLPRHRAVRIVCLAVIAAALSGTVSAAGPFTAQVIGAWQLAEIIYDGPAGRVADPFYAPNSAGMLIYDASGAMSVQIAAPSRQALDVPTDRTTPAPLNGIDP